MIETKNRGYLNSLFLSDGALSELCMSFLSNFNKGGSQFLIEEFLLFYE